MTTTQQPEDQFSFWGTDDLIAICFRVTPAWEQDNWVVTSVDFRYQVVGQEHVEMYSKDQLRTFAVEQLEDYGISIHDVNQMKS